MPQSIGQRPSRHSLQDTVDTRQGQDAGRGQTSTLLQQESGFDGTIIISLCNNSKLELCLFNNRRLHADGLDCGEECEDIVGGEFVHRLLLVG